MSNLIDIFLHLDKHLKVIMEQYGWETYLILFLVIFCETGLVVLPFLPGDALLVAAGVTWATAGSNPVLLMVVLAVAAVTGNMVNYAVGKYFGDWVERKKFIKHEHLEQTHNFYERYGAVTLIVARFVPIVRTMAPFVAGAGEMSYPRFALYNLVGGISWVFSLVFLGWAFGTTPFVQQNLSYITLGIIAVTTLPVLFTLARQLFGRKRSEEA